MAEEKKEQGGTPEWATGIQESLNKLTELLSNPLQNQNQTEQVQEVEVPPPPAPVEEPEEVEEVEVEEVEEKPPKPQESPLKKLTNWLF